MEIKYLGLVCFAIPIYRRGYFGTARDVANDISFTLYGLLNQEFSNVKVWQTEIFKHFIRNLQLCDLTI